MANRSVNTLRAAAERAIAHLKNSKIFATRYHGPLTRFTLVAKTATASPLRKGLVKPRIDLTRKIRARIEHAFARMKTSKIRRDCRLKGGSGHHAMSGITRLHEKLDAGRMRGNDAGQPACHRPFMDNAA